MNLKEIFFSLDTEDYRITESIAVFNAESQESLDAMIKTVAGEFKWLPVQIGGLFIDGIDYNGLEFWYDRVIELVNSLEDKQASEAKNKKRKGRK